MLSDRLSFARDQGTFALPSVGRLCVFGARRDDDLSVLGQTAFQVVQPLKPDHDALIARGIDTVTAPQGAFAAALVVLPRSKAQARDLIARACSCADGGPVWIDGQKTDGAESIIRALRHRGVTVAPVIAKAHGKLFCIAGADLTDWHASAVTLADGMVTSPGAFSADGIDPGSALLADLLPPSLLGVIVDLGAGWGYLSHRIAQRADVAELHLVEADHTALECARLNVTDPRANFHWADALTFGLPGGADHVVTNPPFHTGRAADPALGRAFIAAAAGILKPGGHLWLVANRHLPYEGALATHFAQTADLSDHPAFKVIHARRAARGSP